MAQPNMIVASPAAPFQRFQPRPAPCRHPGDPLGRFVPQGHEATPVFLEGPAGRQCTCPQIPPFFSCAQGKKICRRAAKNRRAVAQGGARAQGTRLGKWREVDQVHGLSSGARLGAAEGLRLWLSSFHSCFCPVRSRSCSGHALSVDLVLLGSWFLSSFKQCSTVSTHVFQFCQRRVVP